MKKRIFLLAVTALLLLSACGGDSKGLPEPAALFSEISAAAGLEDMSEVSGAYLTEMTGITEDETGSAVFYLYTDSTRPDEIIIARAVDDAAAEDILTKLENRLASKEEAARNYLTENLAVIREGVVRRDGLTISLLVSEKVEDILKVYGRYV